MDKEAPSYTERIKYGFELAVGKWFNPTFGARVQITRGPLRGYNFTNPLGGGGYYTQPSDGPHMWFPVGFPNQFTIGSDGLPLQLNILHRDILHDPYPSDNADRIALTWKDVFGDQLILKNGHPHAVWQDFTYMSGTVDLMINLSTLFRGYYKEGNLIDVIPFFGGGFIGAEHSLTNPGWYNVVAKVGARVNVNVTKKISLYLEGQGNITSEEFDGYVGDAPFGVDAVFNASLGVQYTFNRDYATPTQLLSMDEINYLNDKINNNRAMIEKHQDILERQQDLLDRLNNCCDERVVTQTQYVKQGGYLPEYIRFTLNSAKIQPTEEYKLKEAVDFINSNPSSKLLLIGYADKLTGTTNYNHELSRKRVEAVSNELVRRGIDSKRLILEWRGDKEQPYEPNDWNRVVIMVER
jgi:outer membrane protein OmpA-like peptidoglycan-associated protein